MMNNQERKKEISCNQHKVILRLTQDLQRLSLQLVNSMRGRSRIKYGMTALCHNGGFTLIELLVVVLIIGILAAVAVPQYKMAVAKSRVGSFLPVMSSIARAEEVYYLEYGTYAFGNAVHSLDVSMPAACTNLAGNVWKCGTDILLDFADTLQKLKLYYCPGHTSNYDNCGANYDFMITKYYNYHTAYPTKQGKWECVGQTEFGKRMCKALSL